MHNPDVIQGDPKMLITLAIYFVKIAFAPLKKPVAL